jgi:tetratricopeptide (TPR) repeat protein
MKRTGWMLAALLIPAILGGCGQETETAAPAASSGTAAAQKAEPSINADSLALSEQASKAYGEGMNDKAIELAREALKKDDHNFKAYSLLGVAMAMNGSPAEGEANIRKALDINPSYTQANYDLAIALKLQGKRNESTESFKKVLAADPNNTWSYYGIATNYSDDHNKEKALEYLKQAIARGGEDVKAAAREQDHFAWLTDDADFKALTAPKE